MTAKEMFEKLGYTEIKKPFTTKAYRKLYTIADSIEEVKAEIKLGFKLTCLYILFDDFLIPKSVHFRFEDVDARVEDDDILAELDGTLSSVPAGVSLTPEELQAISKQIEELGWNKSKEEVNENE